MASVGGVLGGEGGGGGGGGAGRERKRDHDYVPIFPWRV